VDYRRVAVPLVWVVYPDSRIIRVHRVGTQSIDELRDGDLLTGDALLPGFEAKVTELMPSKVDDPA
jgi:Uma2 family endonuclease